MTRLQLGRSDIYKRDKDEKLDVYIRDELSKAGGEFNLNERMKPILDSKEYNSLVGDMAKRKQFIRYSKEIIQGAKENASKRNYKFR